MEVVLILFVIKGRNPLKKVYKLLLLFCILNALDYITTLLAISNWAVEGNTIANYFVGNNTLNYYKLVGVGLICIYLQQRGIRKASRGWVSTKTAVEIEIYRIGNLQIKSKVKICLRKALCTLEKGNAPPYETREYIIKLYQL